MLTVTKLGLPPELRRSLACTNIIENVMGTVRRVSRNVKYWRSPSMALRWAGAAMQEAAKGFRRLKAYKQLDFSRQRSPFARQEPLHRTRILPKPRRLRRFSISDARFALFNIKRDIAEQMCRWPDIARKINPLLRGWIDIWTICHRPSVPFLRYVNLMLRAWAMRKFKRFAGHTTRTGRFLEKLSQTNPRLFVHWQIGMIGTFA